MSLFNSMVRGFGSGLGHKAAKKTTINSASNLGWTLFKWFCYIAIISGLIEAFTS